MSALPLTEELVRHRRLMLGLARSLVGRDEAEDLVQDLCVRSLTHPPPHGENLRGWMARVLHNLALNRRRSKDRARARDQLASRWKAEARASAELEEHFELTLQVAQAVRELEEPYRSVILLRYFQELPHEDIARMTGQPLATVRTQLRRGLEQLRERLDRERGGREAWSAALVSWIGRWATAESAGSSALLVTASWIGACALALGAGWLILHDARASAVPEISSIGGPGVQGALASGSSPATGPVSTGDTRRPLAVEPRVRVDVPPRAPIPVVALDLDGSPLFPALELRAAHVPNRPRAVLTRGVPGRRGERLPPEHVDGPVLRSPTLAESLRDPGSIGVLELEDPPPVYVSLVLGNVLLDVVEVRGTEERIVLRAASEHVSGMLCEVRFRLVSTEGPLAATRGYGLRARGGSGTLIKTVTDAEGRGACRGVPPGAYELCVQVDGYAFLAAELELAPGETLELGDLLLEPGILIQGQVVDESGAAVDARVSFRRPADPEQELGARSVLASPSEHPGWFAVGDLPQGPLLCRVEGGEWAVNPRWITASGPLLEGLVVEALRGTEVTFVAAGPGAAGGTCWTVAGERGDPVWSQTVDTPEVTVRLLPGRYVVERRGADGRSSSRSFDVERGPRRVEL